MTFYHSAELQERLVDLKEELRSLQETESEEMHKKKAAELLKRIERWNLFSDAHEMQVCALVSMLADSKTHTTFLT